MSNDLLRSSLFFISGAAIASFITYKIVEKKFKNIADEEIESVKETYERKIKKLEEKPDEPIRVVEITKDGVTDITESEEYDKRTSSINPYSSLVEGISKLNNEKKEKEEMANTNVSEYYTEVIPPEDFGEFGYKCESLTYYSDKVLTFDNDEIITDIDKYVGSDSLNTFGEYEDDSVFVRNHGMKTDFEILLDSRRYSDVVGKDE